MDKPLNAAAVFAVLQRIDLRRWGSRAALLCHVAEVTAAAHQEEFALGDRGCVREHTGLAESTIQAHFEALVADRVLVCRTGRGRLGHSYRIQPDVRLWRHVPWRKGTDLGGLALIVELINGELSYSHEPRVAARNLVAQQTGFAARDLVSQQVASSCAKPCRAAKERDEPLAARPIARAASHPLLRDACSDSIEPLAARPMFGQQHSSPAGASPYYLSNEEEEKATQLIDAIQKATGNPVWGGLIKRIRLLTTSGLSHDDALAHIAASGRWTPPQIVGQLEARAEGAPAVPPPAPPEPPPAPPPSAPLYDGWDDRSHWELPKVDIRRPPAMSDLLGRSNGCQNGHTHEEA